MYLTIKIKGKLAEVLAFKTGISHISALSYYTVEGYAQ